MPDFTFDVKAFATVHVTAEDQDRARRMVDAYAADLMEGSEFRERARPGERIYINSVSLDSEHELVEVDGGEDPEGEIAQERKLPDLLDFPEPPYPIGPDHGNNAKRAGWEAFFAGKPREKCPFPPARRDLHDAYREGWDAAKAHPFPDPETMGADLAKLEGRERT